MSSGNGTARSTGWRRAPPSGHLWSKAPRHQKPAHVPSAKAPGACARPQKGHAARFMLRPASPDAPPLGMTHLAKAVRDGWSPASVHPLIPKGRRSPPHPLPPHLSAGEPPMWTAWTRRGRTNGRRGATDTVSPPQPRLERAFHQYPPPHTQNPMRKLVGSQSLCWQCVARPP